MVELMVVQMDGDLDFWMVVHWAGAWVVSWVILTVASLAENLVDVMALMMG